MTKLEAVRYLLSKVHIPGVVVPNACDDEDTTTYQPDPKYVLALATLVDRPITDSDLWFECGGSIHGGRYTISDALLRDVQLEEKLKENAAAGGGSEATI